MENQQEQGNGDGKIVRRFVGGDRAAFREIVDRYENRVETYLARYFKLSHRAADVTQETFFRFSRYVKRHWKVWPEDESIEPLLMFIAARAAADEFRKETKRLEADRLLALSLSEHPSWAEASAAVSQIRIDVQRALEALPPKLREVARLYFLDGYSNEDVAELTALSLTAAKTRIHRARILLTYYLQ